MQRKNIKNRIIAFILSGIMVLSSSPAPIYGEEQTTETSTEISSETAVEATEETAPSELIALEEPLPEITEDAKSQEEIPTVENTEEIAAETPEPQNESLEEAEQAQANEEDGVNLTDKKEEATGTEKEESVLSETTNEEKTETPEELDEEEYAEEYEDIDYADESIKKNILIYSSELQDRVKSDKDELLKVEISRKKGFPENYYAWIEILHGEEEDAVVESLKYYIEEYDYEMEDCLPLWIGIINESGEEEKVSSKTTVKVYKDKAIKLRDYNLFHLTENNEWETVPFEIYEEISEEESYIKFSTKGFSPFVFAKIKEVEPETETEIPEEESDNEAQIEETSNIEDTTKQIKEEKNIETEINETETEVKEQITETENLKSEIKEQETKEENLETKINEIKSETESEAEESVTESEPDTSETDITETESNQEEKEISEPESEISESESEISESESEIIEAETETYTETEEEITESESVNLEEIPEAVTPEIYTCENDDIIVKAYVKGLNPLPEGTALCVEKINEESSLYKEYLRDISNAHEELVKSINIYPYDIHFESNGIEFEPDENIAVNIELKNGMSVADTENLYVYHIKDNGDTECVWELQDNNASFVDSFDFDVDSFSGIVITRTEAETFSTFGTTPLKATKLDTEENVWISKTPNLDINGVKQTNYSHNANLRDVLVVPGAVRLTVTITYSGESTSWDWACVWEGEHQDYTASSNHASSISGKLGGSPRQTKTYTIEGNAVTFGFRSDGSGVGDGYGYYARIEAEIIDSDIPDFHFEELEDGTYALVFDAGGDIEYFTQHPAIQERIAPYINKVSEVRLNKNTTSVGESAFYNLKSLKTVTIPRNSLLSEIGNRAFSGCTSLEEINIPASVTSISGTAFQNCTAVKDVKFDSNSPITELESGTFKGLIALEKAVLPKNMTEIPDSLFDGCTSLSDITYPDNITDIGSYAFRNTKIEELPPLENLTEIKPYAFYGCTELYSIDLPESIKTVGNYAFYGCTGVRTISIDGVENIGNNGFGNLTNLTELNLPDSLRTIGPYAFRGASSLTDIYIPKGVTSIGDYAFSSCTNVKNFIFDEESELTQLPQYIFNGCTKLENVVFPPNITAIPAYCFQGCSSLKTVTLPENCTSIGTGAFYNCTSLLDFEIPSHVKTISGSAFYGCTSLRRMEIPNTVTSIGSSLFQNCSGLISLEFEDGSPITSLPSQMMYSCSKLEDVKLPDGVTAIPASYFYGCSSLKTVELPENLVSIGSSAFYGCYNLETPEFPHTLKTISDSAFYNCDKLVDVVIPNSVTSFSGSVFYGCDGIESIIFEDGSPLTSIGSSAFRQCPNLRVLVLPDKITSIPEYMCEGCTKLEEVELPDKVKTIGQYAFRYCSNLEEIIIPQGATTINNYAFYGCTGLESIQIPSTVTSIGSYAFYDTTSLNEIELPNNITTINSYTFYNSGIKDITLPANLTSIGSYAFYSADRLEEVVIPNKVTSVNNYAFAYCPSLETVTFDDGTSNCSISSYAFYNDYSLKDLDLGNRVSSISYYAFAGDVSLQEITIPGKTTSISYDAFYGDSSVKRLVFEESPTNATLYIGASSNSGNTFAKLKNVEEIVINRNITSQYTSLNFQDVNPEATYTIGNKVDTLDNIFISLFSSKNKIIFEGENDFSTTASIATTSSDPKWSGLHGDFYVDPNGVVYKLDKQNRTASLFHVPEGITDFVLPSTITSVAGVTYNVTSVCSYALREAEDLTTFTAETPENVSLPQYSLAEAPALVLVNGKDEIYMEEWDRVSTMCGFPIHDDIPPEQVLSLLDYMALGEGDDGEEQGFSFGITISNQLNMADDGLTYEYKTGLSARMDLVVSNESNIDMSDRVLRVYFAFDGENYSMGNYAPGNDYTLVNSQTGRRYPFKVRATDANGVYYYDITGFKPGDTLAFNNNFTYTSPTSEGGTMTVWIESLSSAEAAELEGKVNNPKKYVKAEWTSDPVPYRVAKNNVNNVFQFVSNSTDETDENIYVKNVSYEIKVTSSGDTATTLGKDYTKYVDIEDELVLPEGIMWNPEVIEAVRNGDWYLDKANNNIKVKIRDSWVSLITLNVMSTSYFIDGNLSVVEDDNGNDAVKIAFSYRNQYWNGNSTSYPTADFPATTFPISFNEKALVVKEDSNLWGLLREGDEYSAEESAAMRTMTNGVVKTNHYSFSGPQTAEATAPEKVVTGTAGFQMKKTMTSGTSYFSEPHEYDISLTNTGLVYNRDIRTIKDTLREHYYIKADDIERMFADPKWGEYFSLALSKVTLCAQPDNSMTRVDVRGNEVPPLAAYQMGIEPIPYNGLASTDISELTISAKFFIHWNEDKTNIQLDVANDSGVISNSYIIGSNGDYGTLQEAFDAIGYVVTAYTTYDVKWELPDDYVLKSGHTDVFHIPSTTKDTTMWLVGDRRNHYSNSSISSSNYAYAYDETERQLGSAGWTGNLTRELVLTKSGSAEGKSITSNTSISDGSVIDYNLSFTNYGAEYEVLPLTDRMRGTQVLIVPVFGNDNAVFYPNNSGSGVALADSDVPKLNIGGAYYYVFNKAGTYKNVIVDGRVTDTIKVSRAPGYADTLMTWYWQDVTGHTVSTSSVSRNIKYKAIFDTTLLDSAYEDESGNTILTFSLANETWLGGHQTHRLYDTLGAQGAIAGFEKWIVQDGNRENERLIRRSLIQDGNEVLYKIILKNYSDYPIRLGGSSIYDRLPSTKAIFAWSKQNITEVSYDTSHGASVETDGPEYWYVSSKRTDNASDEASIGQYYIRWRNDFHIDFEPEGEIWIYIKLQFPSSLDEDEFGNSDNKWDDYITVNNGAELYNDFYLGSKFSEVTHELNDIVEGKLQKGVLDTGLSGSSNIFISEDTRHFYQNGATNPNGSEQEVAYYTVIYNSGNVRLYLDNLQDELPKGFRFRGLFNSINKAAQTTSKYPTTYSQTGVTSLGYYGGATSLRYLEPSRGSTYLPVASVSDPNRNVTYKNASISASVTQNENGKEQVSFSLSRYSSSSSYLNYDSTLSKYYLNPGEAIRFGYVVGIPGYKYTENIALNEISMPIYDKYGLGIEVSPDVTIIPAIYRDIALNDGDCELNVTSVEIEGYNHKLPSWGSNNTEWFSSNVSLQRLYPVPGVRKTVAGETVIPTSMVITSDSILGTTPSSSPRGGTPYTGTVSMKSIVNWKLSVYNEGDTGSNSLEDYTLVDTVDAPYQFTGNFFFDIYSSDGSKLSSGSGVSVFSLGARTENDTTVKISTTSSTSSLNGTITVNGDPVSVCDGKATVQLLRDNEGVETIIIRMESEDFRVPPHAYLEMMAHTMYGNNDAVLSKQFFNDVVLEPSQGFDAELVSQGRVLYNDNDEAYGIESGASVTMTAGYSSAARKSVTEIANTSNRAFSDQAKNYIMLPEKYSTFMYDLFVDLPTDDPTSKLVLIDTLPEQGDHSPFVARDYRESEFKVHLLSENLDFHVYTIKNNGNGTSTELTPDKYTLWLHTRTEFDAMDWEGAGDGWIQINLADGVSEAEHALLENARSLRVIIDDPATITNPAHAVMPKNTQVKIHFNAEIENPAEADPGEIAWNSFGYRYTVPIGISGLTSSLNAEPLKVGVLIPGIPILIKDLRTPYDNNSIAEEDSTYEFLVYDGGAIAALNDTSEMTNAEIAGILSENSRQFTIITIDISSGQYSGRTGFLDSNKVFVYDDTEDSFIETADRWVWLNGHKYTILELPWEENGYVFSSISRSPINNYTFTQNAEKNVTLRVINEYSKTGNLKLTKTVKGPNFDPNRLFSFTITVYDGGNPIYGTYNYIGTNRPNGTITFNDLGKAVIQLKHNQAIEIVGLTDKFSYSIVEGEDEWYEQTSAVNESGNIAVDQTITAAYENTRRDCSISVEKEVRGNFGNKEKLFRFEIYLVDEGSELNGTYRAIKESPGEEDEEITVRFVDGATLFDLKHGEKLTVLGLPIGVRYEVDELAVSSKTYTVESTNEKGVLLDDVESKWINTRNISIPTDSIPLNNINFILIFIIFMAAALILSEKKHINNRG